MKKNYTHITVLLDRSGSMDKVRQETIDGFNKFVDNQRNDEGITTLSLIQFDDRYEPNYLGINIKDVESLTTKTFVPRGWTHLLDAMGRAIITVDEGINSMKDEDKPSKVLFAILSDGKENRSEEFAREDVAKLVKQQKEEKNWEFVFMGSNAQAILEAKEYGIPAANTIHYGATGQHVNSVMASLTSNVRSWKGGAKADMSFTKSDHDKQSVKNSVGDWASWKKEYDAKLSNNKKEI